MSSLKCNVQLDKILETINGEVKSQF